MAEPSIGSLFEELETISKRAVNTMNKSTEPLEQQMAGEVHDLAGAVSDVLYLLREHLSCHDCRVANHTHMTSKWGRGRVREVSEGIVEHA